MLLIFRFLLTRLDWWTANNPLFTLRVQSKKNSNLALKCPKLCLSSSVWWFSFIKSWFLITFSFNKKLSQKKSQSNKPQMHTLSQQIALLFAISANFWCNFRLGFLYTKTSKPRRNFNDLALIYAFLYTACILSTSAK